jgi:hypothetical protein
MLSLLSEKMRRSRYRQRRSRRTLEKGSPVHVEYFARLLHSLADDRRFSVSRSSRATWTAMHKDGLTHREALTWFKRSRIRFRVDRLDA